jgi:hypothetical protein
MSTALRSTAKSAALMVLALLMLGASGWGVLVAQLLVCWSAI